MRDNDSKSKIVALIQEITQARSDKDARGKNVDLMPTRYRLCKDICSWRIRGRPRRVVRQEISIPASATVAVQRHKIKRVRAESWLNSCPHNRGQRTVNVRQSTGERVSYIFGRWDILQVKSKISSTRHFFHPFHLLINKWIPIGAIFPSRLECNIVRPDIDSCVSNWRKKGTQNVVKPSSLKDIDVMLMIQPIMVDLLACTIPYQNCSPGLLRGVRE